MSTTEPYSSDSETIKEDDDVIDESKREDDDEASNGAESKEVIRYSLSTLLSMRSLKLSQAKPTCLKLDLACMAHHKPPPKMLIANMMPKFALNQMQGRGEESISPLSFHSNSSSSSNLSYQKRYQDREQREQREQQRGGGERERVDRDRDRERDEGGYSNSRYYYNKYKSWDDNGSSSRIIYKTTSANANGNNIRILKKAYNNKYESQEPSGNYLSNQNILGNSSRVITGADLRSNRKLNLDKDDEENGVKSDDTNNNDDEKKDVKSKDSNRKNDLKNLPDDITNQMDDMFSDLNLNQLLPENLTEERESSKFSKWFNVAKDDEKKKGSGGHPPDSQNNNEDGKHRITFPPQHESDKYFQPIDKVEMNPLIQMLKSPSSDNKDDNPLMQMIQGQQKSPGNGPGQVHSVEELEAKLRKHRGAEDSKNVDSSQKVLQNFFQQQQIMPNVPQPQQPQHQPQQHQQQQPQNQEDINAFKKLLSQIAGDDNKGFNMMPPNGQNIFPNPMMNKNFPQPTPDIMMQQFQKLPAAKMMNNPQNPITPIMIPPQQIGNNIEMMKVIQQQQQMQKIPELIKRPEVQALVQELNSGDVSPFTLWQRVSSQGLSQLDREIIVTALNIFNANTNAGVFQKPNNLFPQMKGPPIPIPQGSPLSPVPPSIDQHILFQHQAAAAANAKLRVSPLPAAGFGMGPAVLPANNLTLHVPVMPQRIPSPRELQYHTQSIMQNALIRKKLEEQRENYRKRQEQEQKEIMQKQENEKKTRQDIQPSDNQVVTPEEKQNNESPSKKMSSGVPPAIQQQVQRAHAPSPNIFTPTSVLRKMTAEKDGESSKMVGDKKKAITGQPIRGQQNQQQMISPQQQQQPQQHPFMGNVSQFERMMQQNEAFGNINWDAQSPIKPQQQGPAFSSGRPIVKSAQATPSQNPMQQLQAQQQQQNQHQPPSQSTIQQLQSQQMMQKLNMQMMQMKQLKKQQMDNPAVLQYLAQQQRAQQQPIIRNQHFPQQQMGGFPQQQMMKQEEIEGRGMMNNGGLSPTSNQLAKWFSPELLADASAGKLPSTKMNGGGQMMSLEEFEKCIQNN